MNMMHCEAIWTPVPYKLKMKVYECALAESKKK